MNTPAFQFYVADFLLGTATMAADEVGAYIRLLCHQWDKGALPADNQALRRIAGCRPAALAMVRGKFTVGEDGLLRNERLERERSKQAAFRQAGGFGGRHGGGNPNFKKGQPNPYYDKAKDKPLLSLKNKASDKGSDKAKINIPSPSTSTSSNTEIPQSSAASPPAGSVSPLSGPPAEAIQARPPRARNVLLDALVVHAEATALDSAPAALFAKCAKALKTIREVSPDVTAELIAERCANYRTHFDSAVLTATALASHWGRCAVALNRSGGAPLDATAQAASAARMKSF